MTRGPSEGGSNREFLGDLSVPLKIFLVFGGGLFVSTLGGHILGNLLGRDKNMLQEHPERCLVDKSLRFPLVSRPQSPELFDSSLAEKIRRACLLVFKNGVKEEFKGNSNHPADRAALVFSAPNGNRYSVRVQNGDGSYLVVNDDYFKAAKISPASPNTQDYVEDRGLDGIPESRVISKGKLEGGTFRKKVLSVDTSGVNLDEEGWDSITGYGSHRYPSAEEVKGAIPLLEEAADAVIAKFGKKKKEKK